MIVKVAEHRHVPLTQDDLSIIWAIAKRSHTYNLFVTYARAHAQDYATMLSLTDAHPFQNPPAAA
jgi:hypothetical protein